MAAEVKSISPTEAKRTGKKPGPPKGTRPSGRAKGTPNRSTRVLKEAILMAAENVGLDGKGKDGLVGYLTRVALRDIKSFTPLLGKVLPLQITGDPDNPIHITRIELVAPMTIDHDDHS